MLGQVPLEADSAGELQSPRDTGSCARVTQTTPARSQAGGADIWLIPQPRAESCSFNITGIKDRKINVIEPCNTHFLGNYNYRKMELLPMTFYFSKDSEVLFFFLLNS